eukprot:TRINITY_DN21910_c0_g1_i1.p1 TRINITY_DN21910_c0_g1~~TRINITY_DN21910_c0_g1_i1.p1  ORF type:complete len:139 (+),score=17.66 TRINITY_DN21910_c0_g1_i1:56-472(+)
MGSVVSLPVYASRVAHMLSGMILFAGVASPFLYEGSLVLKDTRVMIAASVITLFTGLFNAGALEPKRMKEAAKGWRLMIYAGKGTLFLACTPLADKLVGSENGKLVKAAAVTMSVMIASYSRFYREHHVKIAEKKADN